MFEPGSKYQNSKYAMGNGITLSLDDCNGISLAKAILELDSSDVDELNTGVNPDLIEEDKLAEAREFAGRFDRKDGYFDQIKKHLNVDLTKYDKDNREYQSMIYKILYLVYFLNSNKSGEKNSTVNILRMLGKPSMENIYSFPLNDMPINGRFYNWDTCNGAVIGEIKSLLEQELYEPEISNIKRAVNAITPAWDKYLDSVREESDALASMGEQLDIEAEIRKLNVPFVSSVDHCLLYEGLSPIGMFYFRILQNEFLGQILDIERVNSIEIESNYSVPVEMAKEMKSLHNNRVDIKDTEEFITKNVSKIEKYVYLKDNISKDERRRIQRNAKKVGRILEFCQRARPSTDMGSITTELLIISCLQAIILDKQNETLNYKFYCYQDYMKHKPRVQAALKSTTPILDVMKIYWTRKVVDHWYANIGRYNLRCELRKLENVCDKKLERILTCETISEMMEAHMYFYRRVILPYYFLIGK